MLKITAIYADYARVEHGYGDIVERANPVISWSAASEYADSRQEKYRLRASLGKQTLYDSGWAESREQRAQLPENTLPQGGNVEISVQIEDNHSRKSEPLTANVRNAFIDWDAEWIGDKTAAPNGCVYLRKRFDIRKSVREARLYVAGLGYCLTHINGDEIDIERSMALEPPFTDYSRRVNYEFFADISYLFKKGKNEISCVLGSGWRQNTRVHDNQWLDRREYSFEGPMQLSAMLKIIYENGAEEWIKTDDSWDVGTGPMVSANIFDGAVYDARREISFARKADILPAPGGKMLPSVIPPTIAGNYVFPVARWPDGENAFILDFGKNIAGVIELTIPEGMRRGDKIIITHSEELTEDGRLFRDTLRNAKAEDVYIASGDDVLQPWSPAFTYHGFRYARVEGIGAQPSEYVVAIIIANDLRSESMFRCGSALVTRIHEMCVDTERANMVSILTDCPQRDERMGWLNDATVRFEATPYNFNIGRMFHKIARDILDVQAQNDFGGIGCTAPFIAGSIPADPVCSSFLIAGYESAMHAGNMDVIKEAYPGYVAWENCLLENSDNYIVNYSNYGDWAAPLYACDKPSVDDPGAVSAVTPGIFMSTGYSYYNCVLLEKFANRLGLDSDARKHAETASAIKAAMLDKWYEPETGKMATGSQACQAFALWLGIIPESGRAKAAKLLNDDLINHELRFTTGNLCTRYIMDALTENGYIDTAWELITKETYPSLGYMLQQEATTVWERFELMKNPNMNSHNHPMYGAVDYWLYRYIAGLKPIAPGWREFELAPVMPEKLMSAQATLETPMGEICARWTKRYGGAHLHVSVPFGATARVTFGGETRAVGSGFHAFHHKLSTEG